MPRFRPRYVVIVLSIHLYPLAVGVIQRAYRRHRDRTALEKKIAIKKLVQGNDMRETYCGKY